MIETADVVRCTSRGVCNLVCTAGVIHMTVHSNVEAKSE
jgi:hypothetical protein